MSIYIGWDSREVDAYNACVNSINTNSEYDIPIAALKADSLEARGLYNRKEIHPNEKAATEFAFTRFLTPYLSGFQGWSLFIDCDFIITRDIQELFDLADDKYAVMVVKHDYVPRRTTKMDDQPQIAYPRKNWSSTMLFNGNHPATRILTPRTVSEQSGAFLHRFEWLDDDLIGELPLEWNWLEGEYDKPDEMPAIIHYTQGGVWFPWMAEGVPIDYWDEWLKYSDYSAEDKDEITDWQRTLHGEI